MPTRTHAVTLRVTARTKCAAVVPPQRTANVEVAKSAVQIAFYSSSQIRFAKIATSAGIPRIWTSNDAYQRMPSGTLSAPNKLNQLYRQSLSNSSSSQLASSLFLSDDDKVKDPKGLELGAAKGLG